MKKTVVTILLVLPFLLIYFISFTGQVLSQYTHIYVERVVVLDEKGDEYNQNEIIKINLSETFDLRIKIYPELASNKKVKITNGNSRVCTVDEENYKVTASSTEFGESNIIITSEDRHFVQFSIIIKVAQDEPDDIIFNNIENYQLTIPKGKTFAVDFSVVPETTISEYKELIWQAVNPQGQNIISVTRNGVIKAINEGTAKVIVKTASDKFETISKEIIVTVTLDLGNGVWFQNDNPIGSAYLVTNPNFDLKTITRIIGVEGVDMSDLVYKLETSPSVEEIDYSNISSNVIANGEIKFLREGTIVKVSVNINTDTTNGYNTNDVITLVYLENPPII